MKTIEVRFSEEQSSLEKQAGVSVVSQVSWETLKPYLEKVFMVKKSEKILGIIFDEKTITAYFGNKN